MTHKEQGGTNGEEEKHIRNREGGLVVQTRYKSIISKEDLIPEVIAPLSALRAMIKGGMTPPKKDTNG